jgi:hypothetical protein
MPDNTESANNAATDRFNRRIDCSDGDEKSKSARAAANTRHGRGVCREEAFPKSGEEGLPTSPLEGEQG